MLELRGVCAGYGGVEVLHDVSCAFPPGSCWCVLGPNGCGKTTLLRHIERNEAPKSGLPFAMMPQRYTDLLREELSPVAFLHTEGTREQLTEIRLTLGAMRFTREEMVHVQKRIEDKKAAAKHALVEKELHRGDANA